jgi:hypothetical protein
MGLLVALDARVALDQQLEEKTQEIVRCICITRKEPRTMDTKMMKRFLQYRKSL